KFIKMHGADQTEEQILKRRQGMSNIRKAMEAASEAAIRKTVNSPLIVRTAHYYTFRIASMISANIREHVKHNLENPDEKLSIAGQKSLIQNMVFKIIEYLVSLRPNSSSILNILKKKIEQLENNDPAFMFYLEKLMADYAELKRNTDRDRDFQIFYQTHLFDKFLNKLEQEHENLNTQQGASESDDDYSARYNDSIIKWLENMLLNGQIQDPYLLKLLDEDSNITADKKEELKKKIKNDSLSYSDKRKLIRELFGLIPVMIKNELAKDKAFVEQMEQNRMIEAFTNHLGILSENKDEIVFTNGVKYDKNTDKVIFSNDTIYDMKSGIVTFFPNSDREKTVPLKEIAKIMFDRTKQFKTPGGLGFIGVLFGSDMERCQALCSVVGMFGELMASGSLLIHNYERDKDYSERDNDFGKDIKEKKFWQLGIEHLMHYLSEDITNNRPLLFGIRRPKAPLRYFSPRKYQLQHYSSQGKEVNIIKEVNAYFKSLGIVELSDIKSKNANIGYIEDIGHIYINEKNIYIYMGRGVGLLALQLGENGGNEELRKLRIAGLRPDRITYKERLDGFFIPFFQDRLKALDKELAQCLIAEDSQTDRISKLTDEIERLYLIYDKFSLSRESNSEEVFGDFYSFMEKIGEEINERRKSVNLHNEGSRVVELFFKAEPSVMNTQYYTAQYIKNVKDEMERVLKKARQIHGQEFRSTWTNDGEADIGGRLLEVFIDNSINELVKNGKIKRSLAESLKLQKAIEYCATHILDIETVRYLLSSDAALEEMLYNIIKSVGFENMDIRINTIVQMKDLLRDMLTIQQVCIDKFNEIAVAEFDEEQKALDAIKLKMDEIDAYLNKMPNMNDYDRDALLCLAANIMARFYENKNSGFVFAQNKIGFFKSILSNLSKSNKKLINEAINMKFEFFRSNTLSFELIPADLTLPDTKKKIEEKGYKGIKKNLYTAFVELHKFLFMSSKYFSALHDNFDTFQYEKRLKRTRILKAVVFSLTALSIILTAVFMPPVIWLIPVAAKVAAILSSGAFSLLFFGVVVHAINNFIEDRRLKSKPLIFTLFTDSELDEKLQNSINNFQNVDLNKEISFLTDNKDEILSLFRKTQAYLGGAILKNKMQKLIEAYSLKAIAADNRSAQNALLELIYDFSQSVDSLAFQESMLFKTESEGKSSVDDKKYETLKFFYTLNLVVFKFEYNLQDLIHRINNQKRFLKLLFSDKRFAVKDEYLKLFDDIEKQIFLSSYLETLSSVPDIYLQQILTEFQFEEVKSAEQDNFDAQYLLSDIAKMNIPKNIGYMYIGFINKVLPLRSLFLNRNLPASYRLYALLKMSSSENNQDSVISQSGTVDEKAAAERKIDIDKSFNADFALKVLEDAAGYSYSDNYLNSLEAEMLFTAAAVALHEKYPNIDIVEFLSQLKFTFVRNNKTEFIVKYSGSDESEYVQIAMDDNKEYIDSIKDFVESVYKRNIGDKTDGNNAKFKSVAKGPSALIKAIRKTSLIFLLSITMFLTSLFFSVDPSIALSNGYIPPGIYLKHNVNLESTQQENEYVVDIEKDVLENLEKNEENEAEQKQPEQTPFNRFAKPLLAVPSVMPLLLLFFRPVLALPFMALAVVFSAAFRKKVVNTISVHYRFIKERISLTDLDSGSFGVKEMDGEISVPVYMINTMPAHRKGFKFKNTGVKIDGKSVWISSASGVFAIFAEGASLKEIEDAVKGDNSGIRAGLSKFVKKAAGKTLDDKFNVRWFNMELNAAKTSFGYDDGTVRASLSAEDASSLENAESDFMTGVRDIADADAMAMVENIYYFLDNVKTPEDLSKILGDFQKIGNGQIILSYDVLKNNLDAATVKEFFSVARQNGIKIIADHRGQDISSVSEYRNVGFDGVLYNASEDKLSVYDFVLATTEDASVVEGYASSQELISKLRETKNIKILNNSEIVSKISKGDSSIVDRVWIVRVLKESAIFDAISANKYTEDTVKRSAYNLAKNNFKNLENIGDANLANLLNLLNAGNVKAVREALNLPAVHAVNVYLNDIGENVKNENEVMALQKAYLEAIFEKFLVNKTVVGDILSKTLEKQLGKALRLQIESGKQAQPAITAEEFKEEVRNKTNTLTAGKSKAEASKIFSRKLKEELHQKVTSLADDAFVKKDAAALAGIIELIPAIAEVRLNMKLDKDSIDRFDVRELKNLLS
ncbi:MAG: hypothetical protein LBL00_01120, partial [Endomicrobium sp.]|nr:hypothetical protein [Endomicrobium sp.]